MGGPVVALLNIAEGLVSRGHQVSIVHVEVPGDRPVAGLPAGSTARSVPGSRALGFRRATRLRSVLEEVAGSCDVVHSHGLWTSTSRESARLCHGQGIPHLVTIHGMLARDALRFRGWKKRPIAWWFQDRALRDTKCLHVTSAKELDEVRNYGLTNPVAVVPMPIRLPGPSEPFLPKGELAASSRVVLFLGRLHPVKGVARLLDAWCSLGESIGEWKLVIAGPGETEYVATLKDKARILDGRRTVLFSGELNEAQRSAALQRADLFVMPSDFENFGMAIAEAMAAGLPVIATTGSPWGMLPEANAGWWVEPSERGVANALLTAMKLDTEQLREIGEHARSLAGRFSISRIAQDFEGVYRWMSKQGDKPDCIAI